MLAEDGYDNRRLIKTILRKAGAEVESVENGRLAVARAEAEPFDLILMDINMPEMDGLEATRRLRDHGYTRPILALTANAMSADVVRCLEAGCNEHLAKPIDRLQLLQTIAAYVGRKIADGADAAGPTPELSRDDEAVVSQFADNPEIATILGDFVERLAGQVDAMREAHAAGRHEELQRAAHRLKGAGGSYGYPSLTDACKLLEDAAKAGDNAAAGAALEAVAALGQAIQIGYGAASPGRENLSMKVLIIDDNRDALEVAKIRLVKECLEIVCAEGGVRGLEAARRERPDLILLDLDMPDMSGFDVCRALKADQEMCMTPVLFLSGSAGAEDKVRGLDLGAVDYVAKPFDAFELRARVRAALRTKHLQDMLFDHAAYRPPHRTAQPPSAGRASAKRMGPHPTARRPVVVYHGRYRPLQADQRSLRPPGRRQAAPRGGPSHRRTMPRLGPAEPLRRRGVRHHRS